MFRKIFKYASEFKKESILAPIFISIEVIMETLIPLVIAALIDKGVNQNDMSVVAKMGVLMCGLALISLLAGSLSGYFASTASTGFARNLREILFLKLQEFSFSNIDKFSTSSLITRLTTDVTNVQNAYQMIIRILVRAPLLLIMAFVMSIRISVRLSLIFLIVIPFLGFVLWYVMNRAHPNFEKMFKKYDLVNQVMQEDLSGIRTVKAFVREDYENEKFNDATEQLLSYSRKAEKIIILNTPAMQFSMYICILLISWFGAQIIVVGDLSTGQLTSLFTYVNQILSSLMMVSMVLNMISMSRSSMRRIIEVIEEKSDIVNCGNPLMEVRDGSIDFDHVSFSYHKNENYVLEDINFHIESGETIGILGSTGSSKTSLVNLISRLYDVNIGSIRVGGTDVKEIDLKTLRDDVSVVLQKNVLFSGTVSENIRWGNKEATDEEVIRVCKLAQADEFINEFPDKYNTRIERGGTNVSGGQKQRLCIARALLKKPKILILDDSTSAVDTKTDALIRKAFKEEIPDTTKIIIAQRISSIEDADRVLVLEDGKVNAFDTPENLLKNNEIYREIYNQQVKGGKK